MLNKATKDIYKLCLIRNPCLLYYFPKINENTLYIVPPTLSTLQSELGGNPTHFSLKKNHSIPISQVRKQAQGQSYLPIGLTQSGGNLELEPLYAWLLICFSD